jgi:hypothetical protein
MQPTRSSEATRTRHSDVDVFWLENYLAIKHGEPVTVLSLSLPSIRRGLQEARNHLKIQGKDTSQQVTIEKIEGGFRLVPAHWRKREATPEQVKLIAAVASGGLDEAYLPGLAVMDILDEIASLSFVYNVSLEPAYAVHHMAGRTVRCCTVRRKDPV